MTEINEKREKEQTIRWRAAITVSSILIVLIGGFFLFRMFTSNPLEGSWQSDDSDMTLTIKGDQEALISWPEKLGGSSKAVRMGYQLDMDTKTFSLYYDDSLLEKAEKKLDGEADPEEVESVMESMESMYGYSIDQNQLTLTDREYGDQLTFNRK